MRQSEYALEFKSIWLTCQDRCHNTAGQGRQFVKFGAIAASDKFLDAELAKQCRTVSSRLFRGSPFSSLGHGQQLRLTANDLATRHVWRGGAHLERIE
jgi:hypothetical protein